MRAGVCRAWGEVDDLRVEEVAAPNPGPGEVLIAVKATAVNYADALMTSRTVSPSRKASRRSGS